MPDADGRVAIVRNDHPGPRNGLYAVDPDGSDLTQLSEGGMSAPAWSPDGTRLAVTLDQPDGSQQIATMAPDGTDVRILTSGDGVHEGPTWSPDGTWIAYDFSAMQCCAPGFHTVLYRIDADGSRPKLLGNPKGFDVEPQVSPDGKSIAFERLTTDASGNQHNALLVRDLGSGAERPIPAAGNAVEHVDWSPDGRWLLFDVSKELTHDVPKDQVERIASDGTGRPVVLFPATSTRGGFKPVYSPEGSRILFGCIGMNGREDEAACVMDADGTNVKVLIDDPSWNENGFSWGVATP